MDQLKMGNGTAWTLELVSVIYVTIVAMLAE
jgi:hypothetical protein